MESGLTGRAYNVLEFILDRKVTPENVAMKFTLEDLKRLPNCGRVTVNEIQLWLLVNGFSLKKQED